MLLLSMGCLLKRRTFGAEVAIPIVTFALPSVSTRAEELALIDACRKMVKYFGYHSDMKRIVDFIESRIEDSSADWFVLERYLRLLYLLPEGRPVPHVEVGRVLNTVHRDHSDRNDPLYLIGSPPAVALHLLRAYFFLKPQSLMADPEVLAEVFVGNDDEMIKALCLLYCIDGTDAFLKFYLYLLKIGVIDSLLAHNEERMLDVALLTAQISKRMDKHDADDDWLVLAQHHLNMAVKYKRKEFSDSLVNIVRPQCGPDDSHG